MINRQHRITIRVSNAELKKVQAKDKASNSTISDIIRQRALGKQIVPQADLDRINRLKHQFNELRRLGQSLKKIHTETQEQEEYSNDMAFAIREIEIFVRKCAAEFPCSRYFNHVAR